MVTPDELRSVGFQVTEDTDTWTVVGFNRTWVFRADDQVTARRLYEFAVSADNIDLRTQAEAALKTLDDALARWDALTTAEFRGVMKVAVRLVAHLTRLAIRQH